MGKRKRAAKPATTQRSDASEDISLDFSKFTTLFKTKKTTQRARAAAQEPADESAADQNETAVDLSGVKSALARIPLEKVAMWTLLAVLMALVFWIHMLPAQLPVADDWARGSIDQNLRAQFDAQITAQLPNLPQENRNRLIEERLAEFKAQSGDQLEASQRDLAEQFREQFRYVGEDGNSYTYLGDLDSYFWLRYTRNWLNTGLTCDVMLEDGSCRDMFTLAPVGTLASAHPELHVFAIAFMYKLITIFNPDYPLIAASFMLQAVMGLLGVIPAFFIGRRLAGNAGGVATAILVMLNPLILSRSLGSDNDAFNTTVFMFLLWMIILAVDARSWKPRITFTLLTSVFIAVYAASWAGWWFAYLSILIGLIGAVGYHALHHIIRTKRWDAWTDQSVRADLFILVGYYAASFVFLLLAGHGGGYFQTPVSALGAQGSLDQAVGSNYWPNVLTTVAELNKSDIGGAIGQLGGKKYFFGALLGILLLLLPKKSWNWRHYATLGASMLFFVWVVNNPPASKFLALLFIALPIGIAILLSLLTDERLQVAASLIVLVWFLAAVFATYSGVRFILLLVPVFAIGFGVLLGRLHEWGSRYLETEFNLSKSISAVLVFIVVMLTLITPVKAGYQTAYGFIPSIDDGWWDALTKIKMESAPDAIINSWWDFGHWFKYVAERRVSADGTTQGTHVPRWLGLALVTPDERESVGILRMLDCGSDAYPAQDGDRGAYGKTLAVVKDPLRAESIVREIARLDRDEAFEALLAHDLTQAQAQDVLLSSHCEPPENYFITSEDMVGKAGVWAHFGLWNFTRAYIAETSRTLPRDEAIADFTTRFGYTQQQAQQIYFEAQGLRTEGEINAWISPWPGYLSSWRACNGEAENGTIIICPIGAVVGQQPNNVQSVIDVFIYNTTNESASMLIFGFYQNGQRIQQNAGQPATLIIADDTLTEIRFADPASPSFGMIYDAQLKRVMIADPLLARSMFTQLFYLDGRYNTYYEKFDDRTTVGGQRILTWNVNWDGAAPEE